MVQIPRVPSRGSARTFPKTASYIFLLSMTSRRGGARTQTLAKDSARASLLKPNLAHHARFSRALAQRLGTCCSGPSTSRARDAVPRRDSRRGASHGGVPVRALRPRARVRDVAREPALRPSCVPNPPDLRPFLPDLMTPTLRLTRTNTSRPVNIRLTTKPRPTHPLLIADLASTGAMDDPAFIAYLEYCLLYTSPSPRDKRQARMPSSA